MFDVVKAFVAKLFIVVLYLSVSLLNSLMRDFISSYTIFSTLFGDTVVLLGMFSVVRGISFVVNDFVFVFFSELLVVW